MKQLQNLLPFSFIIFLLSTAAFAQDDENRQATGLPTEIKSGAVGTRMVVSGKIIIDGVESLERKPIINITILVTGAPFARTTARDTGFYSISGIPRQDVTMLVEVDGIEVSRQPLVPSPMGNMTIDMTVPIAITKSLMKPGVISARTGFERNEKNQQIFEEAMAAVKANENAKAMKLLDQLLAAEPKDYEAWTEIGTISFKSKANENAEKAYLKAIELKKDYFVALLNLGKLYFSDKKFDNAILVLSNAVKVKDDSADAHHFLGESYLQVKKGSLAVGELNKAITLAPAEKADLHLRLAALYDAANLKPRAAEEYKLFLAKRPDHPDKKKFEKYIEENLKQ